MDFTKNTQDTIIQELSTTLEATLSALQVSDIFNFSQELSSALQQLSGLEQLSYLDNFFNSLSSMPRHPYERLLLKNFGPGYTFKTIDDVPEPEYIPVKECLEYMNKRKQVLTKTMFHNLTCCPEQKITSGFESLSGDTIVCDTERQKNYIEFFEMVRQIPIESVTEDNYQTIAKKIISEYIRVI